MKIQKCKVNAPFEMPEISSPDFSATPRFLITDFGAIPGDKEKTAEAIKQAIELASKNRGGRVIIPRGCWLAGPIHLKSGVNLHIEQDAILEFSEYPEDYLPAVRSSWEGLECMNYSPLVYAYGCENIAISGAGTLKANVNIWQRWYERPASHLEALAKLHRMSVENVELEKRNMCFTGANLRPHFIQFNRCKNILVENIRIEHSPFWVIHPYRCEDVLVRKIKIKAHGHNSDGIDPEMTQNMLIEDCIFDQGDDAISIKAGRDQEAWRIDRPSKNIVIRNCKIVNGHQMLAIGSELSAGIENIFIDDCHFESMLQENLQFVENTPDDQGFGNLVYLKTNEYRGGYVRNIHIYNCTATNLGGGVLAVETDVLYQWRSLLSEYEPRLTQINGFHFKNIKVDSAKFVSKIEGDRREPVNNIFLESVKVEKLNNENYQNENIENFQVSD